MKRMVFEIISKETDGLQWREKRLNSIIKYMFVMKSAVREFFLKVMIRLGTIMLACWFIQSCTAAVFENTGKNSAKSTKPAAYQAATPVGFLPNRELNEVSGLAGSRLDKHVLWAINDSGNDAVLYAVSTNGTDLARVRVAGAQNRDWEDLASFRLNDTAYLLIADVGDNAEIRADYIIYIIREPVIAAGSLSANRAAVVEARIRFIYEDGSHDCESVAVDFSRRQILLLTKRDVPPALYAMPLAMQTGDSFQVARRLVSISTIPQPTFKDIMEDPTFGPYRSQPTAMDVSPDGLKAVVLTYKNAYLFQRASEESWTVAFKKTPQILQLPKLRQAEALCFAADAETLFITSEKHPAPLFRLDLTKGSGR